MYSLFIVQKRNKDPSNCDLCNNRFSNRVGYDVDNPLEVSRPGPRITRTERRKLDIQLCFDWVSESSSWPPARRPAGRLTVHFGKHWLLSNLRFSRDWSGLSFEIPKSLLWTREQQKPLPYHIKSVLRICKFYVSLNGISPFRKLSRRQELESLLDSRVIHSRRLILVPEFVILSLTASSASIILKSNHQSCSFNSIVWLSRFFQMNRWAEIVRILIRRRLN